jgi:hypothetical protein
VHYPDKKVRVLVVWEPILATDWRAPSRSTLARIPDRRARQFWDPKHLVTEELTRIAKQKSGQPAPDCCVKKGFHWDEVLLYAPHARWSDGPTPAYWNGPVFRIAPALEKALNEQP